jgi:hypothetical protein
VDKKRSGRKSWEVELFSLRSRIPLSNYQYVSKIKEKLAPAHEELVSKGFLRGVSYRKNDAGQEYAAYEITEDFQARRAAVASRALSADELFGVQRLQAEGMARETAEGLVSAHGTARVMHYVEALPHQKKIRNPAGWLKKAIENNYELDMPPALFNPSHDELLPPDPVDLRGDSHGKVSPEPDPAGGADAPEPLAQLRPDPEAEQVWHAILSQLEDEESGIDASSLRVWFRECFGTTLEDGTLRVAVPNTFAKEYIESRFATVLGEALTDRIGEDARLEVVVGERSDEPAGQPV